MTPGEYLRKRRTAAGLTLGEVVRQLALMQFGVTATPRAAIQAELERAESSHRALSLVQAQVLRAVFPLDPAVYEALALRWFSHPVTRSELPEPRTCHACACSWNDPCRSTRVMSDARSFRVEPCHWLATGPGAPPLCSACGQDAGIPAITIVPAPAGPPVPEAV